MPEKNKDFLDNRAVIGKVIFPLLNHSHNSSDAH